MNTAMKEKKLQSAGYVILHKHGNWTVTDPFDDEDGFSLKGNNKTEIIDEAYDHIFLN